MSSRFLGFKKEVIEWLKMENIIMNNLIDYSSITESPNLKATREQLARLYQRYHFARQFAKDKEVLEVACGSGIGLGYLAKVAKSVVGGDVDKKNVNLARENYKLKDEREVREDKKLRRWEDIENEKMRSCEDGKLGVKPRTFSPSYPPNFKHFRLPHLSLSELIDIRARMIPMIQNRTITLDSGQPSCSKW